MPPIQAIQQLMGDDLALTVRGLLHGHHRHLALIHQDSKHTLELLAGTSARSQSDYKNFSFNTAASYDAPDPRAGAVATGREYR